MSIHERFGRTMGGRLGHDLNGPGEVPTRLTLNQKLGVLRDARENRDLELHFARNEKKRASIDNVCEHVKRAWDYHWIVMSALYALGIHEIPKAQPKSKKR